MPRKVVPKNSYAKYQADSIIKRMTQRNIDDKRHDSEERNELLSAEKFDFNDDHNISACKDENEYEEIETLSGNNMDLE